MFNTLKKRRNLERVIRPGGLKHVHFGVCASVLSILCVLPSFGATNPQITKLIQQKQQKVAQLEQCAKKVNGFKIAGISTLGVTAVGIGGNIALASKNKKLNTEIDDVNDDIESEEKKLANINAKIDAENARLAEEKRKAAEAEQKKQQYADAAKAAQEAAAAKAAQEAKLAEEKAKCGKENKKEAWDDTENKCVTKEQAQASQSKLQQCLKDRENLSLEARACCYVSGSIAKWDGSNCKCVKGGTFKFDEKNISKKGTCVMPSTDGGNKNTTTNSTGTNNASSATDANKDAQKSSSSGSIGTLGMSCVTVDLPTGAKSGKYVYSSDSSKKKCYQSKTDKTTSGCTCQVDSCDTNAGYVKKGDVCEKADDKQQQLLCVKRYNELKIDTKFASYYNGKYPDVTVIDAKYKNADTSSWKEGYSNACQDLKGVFDYTDGLSEFKKKVVKTEKVYFGDKNWTLPTTKYKDTRICFTDISEINCSDFKIACDFFKAQLTTNSGLKYLQCNCINVDLKLRDSCWGVFGKTQSPANLDNLKSNLSANE